MTKKERCLFLGISSEKFLDLIENGKDPVAFYLDDQMSEAELFMLYDDSNLVYGLIAMNWHILHGIVYEYTYVKLSEKEPFTQDDFDICLEELLLLPSLNSKNDQN